MNKRTLFAIVIVLLPGFVWAGPADMASFDKDAYIASGYKDRIVPVSIDDCIMYTFQNNSEIKITRIEPQVMKDDIIVARSVFEPNLDLLYNLHDNTKPSITPYVSGSEIDKQRTGVLNAGISGKVITGLNYNLEFLSTKIRTGSEWQVMDPAYKVEPKITISQPVLRGGGIFVNRAQIMIASNNEKQSVEDFKQAAMEIITKTVNTYYQVYFYREAYIIAEGALARAKNLMEINELRYQKGLVSSVDLLETEAAVAEKEKYILTAEQGLLEAADNLKLITNVVDDPGMWNARLELLDKPLLSVRKVDLLQSLQTAFEMRPDYFSAQIGLENQDIIIKLNRNALWPTLDLVGSFGLNGLGDGYRGSIDNIKSEYRDWSAGVVFRLPWGSGDRARYDMSKLQKQQALLAFKRLEQRIILEVRDKVRTVDIQYRQVQAASLAQRKERQNYKAQEERYAAGQVSTHDMLDYQDRLALAELDYAEALIKYNVAIINLEQVTGTTLTKNNIQLEE